MNIFRNCQLYFKQDFHKVFKKIVEYIKLNYVIEILYLVSIDTSYYINPVLDSWTIVFHFISNVKTFK